jgi:uncharacterized low-complexity protein
VITGQPASGNYYHNNHKKNLIRKLGHLLRRQYPMSKKNVTPLAAAIGTAFALSIAAAPASADVNPFGMTDLSAGYQQVAEGKCGEGKCGAQKKAMKKGTEAKCGGSEAAPKAAEEGKCGGKPAAAEGKCGAQKKATKKGTEGKCGEGKCGGK